MTTLTTTTLNECRTATDSARPERRVAPVRKSRAVVGAVVMMTRAFGRNVIVAEPRESSQARASRDVTGRTFATPCYRRRPRRRQSGVLSPVGLFFCTAVVSTIHPALKGEEKITVLRSRLGAMMQRQRQRLGLTQAVLAERAELSLKYLGEIERGEANVTVEALERVAAALNWDPWELFSLERRPISQNVHQLLLAEILSTRQRLQALADWLAALDPSLRPPTEALPPFEVDGEPHKADGTKDRRRGPRGTPDGGFGRRPTRRGRPPKVEQS